MPKRFNVPNKYRAKRTFSTLCNIIFDSRAECVRGEELFLLEQAGEITDLEYQVSFKLYEHPSVKIKLDFKYQQDGAVIYEDVKGILEREFRVKLCWLKEKHGVDVRLLKSKGKYWDVGCITEHLPESTG